MNSAETKSYILDGDDVKRKIRRMALEIAEQNSEEKAFLFAGIVGNGILVAQAVADELKNILPVTISVVTLQLDKKDPLEVTIDPQTDIEGKVIILADDVSNTGKTMFYALKPFLQAYPKKLQTLVLVERSHKQFPIQTDYTGLTLATTLQEHIAVEAAEGRITGACLY
ncbi:phosphoribosyltransferase [Flavisolibacter sp. BT320]|nr:phosphoribosyltransferase [Flavisolibacter longurius]